MKTKLKTSSIILITLATFFGAIALFLSGVAIYAHTDDDRSKPNESMAVWMSYIKDDALLKDIVIPGSHDSATKDMIYAAKTQSKTVADQLLCGMRYLDIRVGYKDDVLKIYHGPIYGDKYEPVLKQIQSYVSTHPTEVVILDLQHFDNGAKADALELTKSYLSQYFVTNDTEKSDLEFIDTLVLSACRGKILLLLGEDEGESEANNYIFKRNNDEGTVEGAVIRSDYVADYNSGTSSDYVNLYLPVYMDSYKANPVGLFVLQGQLTDLWYVRGLRLRERTHSANMDAYTIALSDSPDLKYVNIIIRDYVGPKKNVVILQLNLNKKLVNSSSIAAYTAMCA